MTTKRVVWIRPDGGVSITTPVETMGDETETEYLDRIANKVKADGAIPIDWARVDNIDVADIPTDRSMRNAWEAA
jgi:hypothetical protein